MVDLAETQVQAYLTDFVDRNAEALAILNDSIFYFGELGMQEFRTAELMCDLLEDHGFVVERGASGFPTGFVAIYGSGSPVVALHCEYDGNPTNSQKSGVAEQAEIVPGAPGHCEGHNSNAAVMITAAVGLRHAMEKYGLRGTIKIVGAPAEETLVSRPFFVRDGIFDDVDVAFHNHIMPDFRSEYGHIQYAAISAEFIFHGEAAHAAVHPEKARDALDAVVLMDMGMAQYREHFEPGVSAQRVITDGGRQPNVIPPRAAVWWTFRHKMAEGARAAFEQGKKIAGGAAMMTNCEVEVDVRTAVWPVRLNETAAKVIQKHIEAIGVPDWTDAEQAFARALQAKAGKPQVGLFTDYVKQTGPCETIPASNDSGDVSWKVPMARVGFPGNVPGVTFHHWTAGAALATSIAHKGAVVGAKALGAAVLDYLTDDGSLIEETRKTFAAELDGTVHRTLLPEGQTPPIELNRAEMEKYRAAMEPHYLKERPVFVA